jgi:hypothetical protein
MLKNLLRAALLCCAAMSTALASQVQPSAANAPTAASEGQNESGLEARIAAADLVVVGQVRFVRPGPKEPFVSEHNAHWQDATVEVQRFIKGSGRSKRIVVRFPAAMDIAWVRSPKLKAGEKHIFILKKDKVTQSVYTALDPQDVLPENDLDRVLDAAGGSSGTKRMRFSVR